MTALSKVTPREKVSNFGQQNYRKIPYFSHFLAKFHLRSACDILHTRKRSLEKAKMHPNSMLGLIRTHNDILYILWAYMNCWRYIGQNVNFDFYAHSYSRFTVLLTIVAYLYISKQSVNHQLHIARCTLSVKVKVFIFMNYEFGPSSDPGPNWYGAELVGSELPCIRIGGRRGYMAIRTLPTRPHTNSALLCQELRDI